MQASAARREEIQKRLQLLKDEKEREQRAFDQLAATNPGLSVEELTALAQKKAKEDIPTSIEVAGAVVRVNEYVGTIDDAGLLALAERGYLVRDPVKRVYLGEHGKVVRVMPSFQGKPAVELRFADGAEKIFFAECLDVGEQSPKKRAASASGADRKGSIGDEAGHRASKGKGSEEQAEKAVPPPVPAWSQLVMPRRGSECAARAGPPPPPLPEVAVLPPPPAAPPALLSTATATAKAEDAAKPLAKPAAMPPSAPVPATALAPAPEENLLGPSPPPSPVPPLPLTSAPPQQLQRLQQQRCSPAPMGLVPEALPAAPSRHETPCEERLGHPDEDVFSGTGTRLGKPSPEMDDLVKTPRPDFLEVSPPPQVIVPCPVEESQIPRRCPRSYEAKFAFDDGDTHIPRFSPAKPVDVRRCWVAGFSDGQTEPLRFQPVALRPHVDSLEAVLALMTRELAWDRQAGGRATRLFTEAGKEIMWPEAVTDGLRLVATQGATYSAEETVSAGNERMAATPTPSRRSPVAVAAAARKADATPAAAAMRPERSPPPCRPTSAAGAHTSSKDPPPAAVRRAGVKGQKSTKSPRTGTATLLSTRVAGGAAKTCPARPAIAHIRVYENGIYDGDKYDRVYRTVTIRPTYKTLSSVKILIARELEWRDGRRVDLLFDATGAEITSLDQLTDGASIVASAGDRFVVPYPNSSLHCDAMKLARQ